MSRKQGDAALPPSIVLVDGEHYPPVTARAIAALQAEGERPVAALLVGGSEKLGQVPLEIGVPITIAADPESALAVLVDLIHATGARRVLDLSDDPVLGYRQRCRMASAALWSGATYVGADFSFTPPDRSLRPAVPSVAVIGTGKRTGKTAITGAAARAYRDAGMRPVVIAMGRGGPPDPEVIDAGAQIDPATLLQLLDEGRH